MANVSKSQREIWKKETKEIYKSGMKTEDFLRQYLNLTTEERYKLGYWINLLIEGA